MPEHYLYLLVIETPGRKQELHILQGKFPTADMPDELVVRDQGGSEDFEIKIPFVSYNGKISQAIERAQRNGGDYYIQNALAYTQATNDPTMLEIVDRGCRKGVLTMHSLEEYRKCKRTPQN